MLTLVLALSGVEEQAASVKHMSKAKSSGQLFFRGMLFF
ncbi:hypothetical protein SPWS13_3983 [Shewanella putrefaciens]|nr:hypothetical protein SPWS13_3983 [Shewanella putrefaciens]